VTVPDMASQRDNGGWRDSQLSDLVGREGVEPSTKRLRAAIPNADAFYVNNLQGWLSSTWDDSRPIRLSSARPWGQP
jgi:hypothetical protein